MKKIKLVFCFTFLFFSVFAQNEKILTLEGEATTEFHDNETRETAQKRAKQNAIINALEKGFGTAINQTNNLQIKNTNIGQKTETKTVFNSISETSVQGDCIEELNVVYEDLPLPKTKSNGVKINGIEIKCSVKIKARESKEYPVSFNAFSLKCNSDTNDCKSVFFKKGESIFIYFKSYKPGYLTIFLDDNKVSQFIFPYMKQISKYTNGFPIEANKEYFLFSKKENHLLGSKKEVDEIEFDPKESFNKIYLIFSPNQIEIPDLRVGNSVIPDHLKSTEFNNWLTNLRLKNKEIEIKRIQLREIN